MLHHPRPAILHPDRGSSAPFSLCLWVSVARGLFGYMEISVKFNTFGLFMFLRGWFLVAFSSYPGTKRRSGRERECVRERNRSTHDASRLKISHNPSWLGDGGSRAIHVLLVLLAFSNRIKIVVSSLHFVTRIQGV